MRIISIITFLKKLNIGSYYANVNLLTVNKILESISAVRQRLPQNFTDDVLSCYPLYFVFISDLHFFFSNFLSAKTEPGIENTVKGFFFAITFIHLNMNYIVVLAKQNLTYTNRRTNLSKSTFQVFQFFCFTANISLRHIPYTKSNMRFYISYGR